MFHIDISNNEVIERTWLVIFSNVREISKLPHYVGAVQRCHVQGLHAQERCSDCARSAPHPRSQPSSWHTTTARVSEMWGRRETREYKRHRSKGPDKSRVLGLPVSGVRGRGPWGWVGDIVRGEGDGADPEWSGGVIGPLGVGGSSSSSSIAAAENVALCCLQWAARGPSVGSRRMDGDGGVRIGSSMGSRRMDEDDDARSGGRNWWRLERLVQAVDDTRKDQKTHNNFSRRPRRGRQAAWRNRQMRRWPASRKKGACRATRWRGSGRSRGGGHGQGRLGFEGLGFGAAVGLQVNFKHERVFL